MASKGRIVYREPNEFAANKYSYSNDKIPKNNITWQQEDFNLLVDLEVVVPNRWGYYDKTPSNNISLLQGCKLNEDYYLTTDYVNVGFSEISNNTKSNREYLGIDSIDIKFDSHFYPIVNIRFTNLRASSLFMPQEEEYKNELYQKAYENTGKEEYKENIKPYTSLFKSFFTFPYPKFLLTVKGFYGTKVTFMLSVADFKSGLDANSGNFTIDVQFIGYLYGMYTDIPMTYLFAAPYMEDNFEESYWSKQIKNGKFKTMDGADIPTFNELYQKILQLEAPNSGLTEQLESDEMKLCKDKIGSLNQIKIAYGELKDTFTNVNNNKYPRIVKNDKLYLIAKVSDEIKIEGTTEYGFGVDEYKNLHKLIDDYNKANQTEQLTTDFYNALVDDNTKIQTYKNKDYYVREHGTSGKIDSSAIICGKKTQTNKTVYDTLTGSPYNIEPKNLENLKNDTGSYNFEIINISEYAKITEEIYNYEEKITELAAKEQKKVDYTKAVSILGFEPTIQNIMRIVFAHMDTFMHYFYELYGNIYAGKSNRVFTTINVQKEETDANIVGGEDYLPPFFALHTKNKNNKKINEYPGKDIRTQDIEEVTFVKRLINSAFIVGSAFGHSERAYSLNLPTELKFSLMSDIDRFMQGVSIYTKFEGLTIGESNGVDNVYNSFCNAVGERLYNFLNETAMYSQFGVSSNDNDLFFFKDDNKTKCRQYIDYEYNMLKQELVDNLSHPVVTYIYNNSKDTFKNDLVKVFDKLVTCKTVNSLVGDKYTNIINQNERLVLLPYTGDAKTIVDSFISSLSDSIGQHKYFGHIYHDLKTDDNHRNYISINEDNGGKHIETITYNKNTINHRQEIYYEYNDIKNIDLNSNSIYYCDCYQRGSYLYNILLEKNNGDNYDKIAFDLLSNLVENYLETFKDTETYKLPLLSNGDILVLPKFFMLYFGAILYRFKKMINGEKVFYDDNQFYEWTGFWNYYVLSSSNNLYGIRYEPKRSNDYMYTNHVGFYPLEFILNQEYGLNIKVEHTNDEFKKNDNRPFLNAVGGLEKIISETTPLGKCEKLFIDFLDKNSNGINIDTILREVKEDCFNFGLLDSKQQNVFVLKPESDLNKTMLSFISEWYVMYSNNERNQLFFLKNNSQKRDIYKNYKTTYENVVEYYYDKLQSDLGTKINNYEAKQSAAKDDIINNDIGYTVYYNLKTLNDKWLCSNGKDNERWQLKSPQYTNKYKTKRFEKGEGKEESEYDSFIFVDSFFNDIGNDLIVDLPMLRKRIQDTKSVSANKEDTFTSVFQFINGIAQDNKLLFVSIPIYSNFHNDESLERIFTPNPSYASGISQGTTYVMMYTHEFSKSLGVNGYENDGFDLGNTIEEISDECGNIFSETNVGDNKINYKVPAFGVTYAMQNQNYFTNISVNMDNPQTTDYGILNTIQISQSTENGDQNSGVLIGQNIYSIYSNRSYTCTVEMLGCMNIMPMMYFQLNNIPMFKGAYMIISVSHQISGGNKMTTKFTGVRISKYLNSLLNSGSLVLKANLEQKTATATNAYIDQITINDESLSLYNVTKEMRHFKIEDMEKQKINNKVVKIPDKYKENAKLLITQILDPLYDAWKAETGGKFYINSGYRVDGNINSAHDYGMAADIIAYPATIENNDKFKEFTCRWLQKNNVEFDQFIDEYSKPNTGSGWIHIGILSPSGKHRKQYKYTNYSTRPGGAKYET